MGLHIHFYIFQGLTTLAMILRPQTGLLCNQHKRTSWLGTESDSCRVRLEARTTAKVNWNIAISMGEGSYYINETL
ncbi:hypothetical protein KUV50_13525 [Membranicola marinus]|uniref:Uncharacterized protein n=1 Tax=Membranihabitans marinus TaxID=1227546 RepID=A0A953HP39_9BACT|nr:hypothetical protein [Membranihabitans marinus]MBY5959167.1 hypothetical protein [Membranihabitans marinus]